MMVLQGHKSLSKVALFTWSHDAPDALEEAKAEAVQEDLIMLLRLPRRKVLPPAAAAPRDKCVGNDEHPPIPWYSVAFKVL